MWSNKSPTCFYCVFVSGASSQPTPEGDGEDDDEEGSDPEEGGVLPAARRRDVGPSAPPLTVSPQTKSVHSQSGDWDPIPSASTQRHPIIPRPQKPRTLSAPLASSSASWAHAVVGWSLPPTEDKLSQEKNTACLWVLIRSPSSVTTPPNLRSLQHFSFTLFLFLTESRHTPSHPPPWAVVQNLDSPPPQKKHHATHCVFGGLKYDDVFISDFLSSCNVFIPRKSSFCYWSHSFSSQALRFL